MKKKITYLLMIVILFSFCLNSVKAQIANSGDEQNGPIDSQTGSNHCGKYYWCNKHSTIHLYVSIEYYDKARNRMEPVKHDGKELAKYYYMNDMLGGTEPVDGINYLRTGSVKGVPAVVETNGWMQRIYDSNGWPTVKFSSDEFEKDTVGSNRADINVRRATFRNFVLREFGYDIQNDVDGLFTKESCEVDLNNPGNCYHESGYRLKAEIQGIRGDGYPESLKTIDYSPDINTDTATKASNLMHIVWSDVKYKCAFKNGKTACTNENESLDCLRDANCGWGIWLVDISKYIQPGYDYSLDMACVNCDSELADSKAVVLQDTTNWEAIEASPRMTGINNASTYFYKKAYDTFCREEYHFFFPNQNDKIKVQLGRYFTLNAKQEDLNVAGADIPNFKPIKVKKIRQCRKGNLSKFNNDSFANFSSCAPDIEVYYKNENVYEYNKDCSKKLEKYTVESATSEIRNNQLTQTAIFYYTLPKDTYRYIQKFDGKSVDFLKEDVAGDDLKVGNFPVAFKSNKERNKANEKIIDIKFTFSLNKCNFSKFDEAYTEKNDYFSAPGTTIQIEDNIYKKYINGKSDANNNINDSACVKLFGSASAARSCIDDKSTKSRTINKMGRCFAEFPKTSGTTSCRFTGSSYACVITDCSPTDPDYNPVTKTCNGGKPDFCDETTAGKGDYKDLVWDPETKQCVGKCNQSNAGTGKYKDLVWDPIKKVCGTCTKDTVGTGIYKGLVWDEVNQKCAPKPSDKCELDCPTYNGEKACCEDASGRSFCGLFIGKKKVCPGKPDIPNMSNLVFRQIDKNNPFTAQDGGNRQTGDNWCDRTDANTNDCSTENKIVTTVIKESNISEEDAMYRVTLDSEDISAIRNYNKKHDYDDFTLRCSKNEKDNTYGSNCISEKFYSETNLTLSGQCGGANHNVGSFNNCVK